MGKSPTTTDEIWKAEKWGTTNSDIKIDIGDDIASVMMGKTNQYALEIQKKSNLHM